jgi:hypothetical protein
VAQIVVGVAASHTPQVSSGVGMWEDHAERDRRNPNLLGVDGKYHTYDELLALADPAHVAAFDTSAWEKQYKRAQDAIQVLCRALERARADVAIVIGDDQREMFRDEGIPSFAGYLGAELYDRPPPPEQLAQMAKGIRAASWAAHAGHPERHLCSQELSAQVIEALVAADFDVTVVREQPPGRSLGHAFTFPRYRLRLPPATPIVPIFVNTYYQPNVPTAKRCYRVGQVLCEAVAAWESDSRVAIIASGGLSHFVLDEALDRRFLDALATRDHGYLCALTRRQMRSGTSEMLNWVTAAGALEHLRAKLADYVPGYRSEAGTGTGMAFMEWN